jgi:hypothetical protein
LHDKSIYVVFTNHCLVASLILGTESTNLMFG